MSLDLLLALVAFAFVMAITPGPNNAMVLASGLSFGFRRSIPHMLGVSLGFSFMVAMVGIGLAQVFERWPVIYTVMKYAGAGYMLWLAYVIASARGLKEGEAKGRPLSFLQAAAFQWVNPKAWVIAIGACAAYTSHEHFMLSMAIVVLVFCIVTLPSIGVWAVCGVGLRRLLDNERALRGVNITMALLLVASLWPILHDLMRDLHFHFR
jgi:threonine/homoserine/homoserine lactone efflux protein